MAYIVADPCVKCKYTDCVTVCPVDCFYEGRNMLVIHPEECINCGACEPECPTTAIFEDAELPREWAPYTSINAVFSGAAKVDDVDTTGWPGKVKQGATVWPCIDSQRSPLPGAEDAQNQDDKLGALDPRSV